MKKSYKTIEKYELLDLYIDQNLTIKEISSKLNLPYAYIAKAIKFYDIRKDPKLRGFRTGQILKAKYADEKTRQNMIKKRRQTSLEKYGTINPAQNIEITKKRQQTILEKYGVSHPCKSEIIKNKIFETNQKKIGCKMPLQNKQCKQKQRQTCYQKYGTDNPRKNKEVVEKGKQTCLKKYGTDNPSKNSTVKQKIRESLKKKTGYYYNFQRPEVIQKSHSIEIMDKKDATKRKNGTFNTSKLENKIYSLLNSKTNIIRNYKNDKYPYRCDFYLPSYDLYIELNFHWTHGYKPFDSTNLDCLSQLKNWKEKSKTSNFYKAAIDTWTRRDVQKLNQLKQNNMKYEIFYTEKEFLNWFKTFNF